MIALAASLAAGAAPKTTPFTTVEMITGLVEQGTMFTDSESVFVLGNTMGALETATDPRVSGNAFIGVSTVRSLATGAGPMWGTFRIENAGGSWEAHWQGSLTLDDGHLITTVLAVGVGRGGYEGLEARWDYTATDAPAGEPLLGTGYIIEAKGKPGDRPMHWWASRTEEFVIHPGINLPSGTQGAMGTFNLLQETGVGSHFGHASNAGFGMIDMATGRISGNGCLTTASKDQVFWVVTGTADLVGNAGAELVVHLAGGTGRFEAAVGELTEAVAPVVWEGEFPVFQAGFSYSGAGWIRY
jgi:hypothetical protein